MFGIGGNTEGLNGAENQKVEAQTETLEQRKARLGGSPEADNTSKQEKISGEISELIADLVKDPDSSLGPEDKMALASLAKRIQRVIAAERQSFAAHKADVGLEGSVADVLAKIKAEHSGDTLGYGLPKAIVSKEIGADGYVVLDDRGRPIVSSSDSDIPTAELDASKGELLPKLSSKGKQSLFESLGAIEAGEDLDSKIEEMLKDNPNPNSRVAFKTNRPDTVLLVTKQPENGDKMTTTIEIGFDPQVAFDGA